jgi:hypothetical protein
VMDMSKSHLSTTIALSEGVDLESINKGKWVMHWLLRLSCCWPETLRRASKVDVKKLEKQEAKLRVKTPSIFDSLTLIILLGEDRETCPTRSLWRFKTSGLSS